jgi:hypothetical protein
MEKDKKNSLSEAARWLRIGTLTITVLGPIINTITARLRKQNDEEQAKELEQSESTPTTSEAQTRLIAVGAALSDLLTELKNNPYGQDLLQRGEEVAGDLIDRGMQLPQLVAKRSSEFSQDLAERSEQVTKEISRRSREVAENSNPAVLIAGFGIGLTITAAAVYLILSKSFKKSSIDEEEPHIELPQDRAGKVIEGHFSVSTNTMETGFPQTLTETPSPAKITQNDEEISDTTGSVPADAMLIGVVNTKHYYPIETPPENLNTADNVPLDVVYFASEDEARAQGFTASE